MNAIALQREIADLLRTESKTVETYLEYARRYANLCYDHAVAEVSEHWGPCPQPGRVIAILALQKETPESLSKKLDALKKSGTKVSHVFVCRHSLSVYVFGPDEN